ncbi:MAG: phosphopentomutase [Turicibacter sp.]|nr:phosphopentomutase [Turicibacter sp.]
MDRVCVIVLDSVGIGEMPDAAEFGDVGAHTLGNILKTRGNLNIPNLIAMGLGNVEKSKLPTTTTPTAAYGRMAEMTHAKDTTSGHWELMGLIMDTPFMTFPNGFPTEFLEEWTRINGINGYLANKTASGTEILKELGEEHMKTGKPIVYTSADSVFQIAAHEEIIPIDKLYKLCETARDLLTAGYSVGRVIARPFLGEAGNFTRTKNRKDYAIEPPEDTVLDGLVANGVKTLGIGKIEDIFCRRGLSYIDHTTNNKDGIEATIAALKADNDTGLIFTNLVDFDMLFGHRNDPYGYAEALEYFDRRLPEIMAALRPNDYLMITADHGCDPTTPSTDHSREYVPILIYGKKVSPQNLGTSYTFADLGATTYTLLTGKKWPIGKNLV